MMREREECQRKMGGNNYMNENRRRIKMKKER